MLKRLLVGATTAIVAAALAAPALADNGAQTVPFLNTPYNPVGSCGAFGGTPSESIAAIKVDGNGEVSADIRFKNENPNDTYAVSLASSFDFGLTCSPFASGQLTTNGQGNGRLHLTMPSVPGTTNLAVWATSTLLTGPDQFVETQAPGATFGP